MLFGSGLGVVHTFALGALIKGSEWPESTTLTQYLFRPICVYIALCVIITFIGAL